MAERQRVVFAYIPRHSWNGSKIMRVDQLCALADLHLGHLYDFQPMQLFKDGQNRAMRFALRDLKDAIVIFLKGGGSCFTDDGLQRLKELARGVCIDHIDGFFGAGRAFPYADVHIVASHAALRAGRALLSETPGRFWPGASIEMLTHHPDPRITFRDASADARLTPGYFGLPKNTVLPDAVAARLPGADIEPGTDFIAMLSRMEESNLHYGVRPVSRARLRGAHVYKPFTKGFNAARAGANIIVNGETDDAVEYLGEDYPYLVDGIEPEAIEDVFRRAEADVGGAEWRRGLDAMASVRARCSHDHIMRELKAILNRF